MESSNEGSTRRSTIGERWKLRASHREMLLFLIFGGINTFASYAIYLGGLLVVPYPVAYTISFVSGIFISYCLNSVFVFREKLRLSKALQYPMVSVIQYVAGLGLLYVLVEVAHVSKLIAPFAVVLLLLPLTYRLSRYIIRR